MSVLQSIDKNIPILVVDDFSTVRRIVKNCLKQLGFENITEAADGSNALETLYSTEIKFIISDWNMPNMMGIDLLKTVRADERLKHIPFLMITPESQKEEAIEVSKTGASNYIVKPFTADVLQIKMEAIFTEKA